MTTPQPPTYQPNRHPAPVWPPAQVAPIYRPSMAPVVGHPVAAPVTARLLPVWQREQILNQFVEQQRKRGWHVHTRHATSAVMWAPAFSVPAWAHALLLIVTFGMWLFVWLALHGPRAYKRWQQVHVDHHGQVHVAARPARR